MRTKKALARVTVIGALVLFLVALPILNGHAATKKPVRLGYMNSLTGPYSSVGVWPMEAIRAYVDYYNKERGGIKGHPIDLIVYDSMSDPGRARLVMKRLITEDKVHVIMGENATGLAIAMGEVAGKLRSPYIANTGSGVFEKLMLKAGKDIFYWNFRNPVPDEVQFCGGLINVLRVLGIKKAVMLYGETGFGRAMAKFTRELAPRFGIDIIAESSYGADARTFGPQIRTIKKAKPEGLLLPTAYLVGALAIKAVREAGIRLPASSFCSVAMWDVMALEKVRKAYGMEPGLYVTTPGGVNFWKDILKKHLPEDPWIDLQAEQNRIYEKRVGKPVIDYFQTVPMPGFETLRNALERLFEDKPDILDQELSTIRKAIRDYIETTRDFNNGHGIVTMSPTNHNGVHWGTSVRSGQYKGFIDGKHVWEYKPEFTLKKMPSKE